MLYNDVLSLLENQLLITCHLWQQRDGFGRHPGSHDGLVMRCTTAEKPKDPQSHTRRLIDIRLIIEKNVRSWKFFAPEIDYRVVEFCIGKEKTNAAIGVVLKSWEYTEAELQVLIEKPDMFRGFVGFDSDQGSLRECPATSVRWLPYFGFLLGRFTAFCEIQSAHEQLTDIHDHHRMDMIFLVRHRFSSFVSQQVELAARTFQ